jgi:hypothetical protein
MVGLGLMSQAGLHMRQHDLTIRGQNLFASCLTTLAPHLKDDALYQMDNPTGGAHLQSLQARSSNAGQDPLPSRCIIYVSDFVNRARHSALGSILGCSGC